MFDKFEELMNYFSFLNNLSFNEINTTPRYMFLFRNKLIYRRFKKEYKELLKFEKLEKRAIKNYWKFKEINVFENNDNSKQKEKFWNDKIEFLKEKREKLINKELYDLELFELIKQIQKENMIYNYKKEKKELAKKKN